MRYLNRGRGSRRGRRRRLHEDEDPLTGVANLFDVAMVFALGLIVALMMVMDAQEVITNPEEMREIIERGKEVDMSQERVTISIDPTEKVSGEMITFETDEGPAMFWIPEQGQG